MDVRKEWEVMISYFEQYLHLERGLAEHSIQAYLADVQKLAEYICTDQYPKLPKDILYEDLTTFLSSLYDIGLSTRSQARIISGIKSFYFFMMDEDIIKNDPTHLIEGPKLSQKIPTVLSFQEIQKILNAIDLSDNNGHRNKAIIETLYSCGLRVSELTQLRLSGYYPADQFIRVIGKNNKERLVPISPEAIKQINYYIKHIRADRKIASGFEDVIFLNRSGKSLTRVMIFTIVKKYAALAGVQKKVSPHTFRHSFATHLVKGGANLRAVQDMLGHESILTTEIYTHLDTQHLRENILQFHPRNMKS